MSRLFIATPVYGGLCTDYVQSILNTVPALERAGHVVQWKVYEGCCYVHLARNKLVRDFLVSECDDLLFVDADLGWQANDVVRLAARDRPIVGGAAPYRTGAPGYPAHILPDAKGFPRVDPVTGLILVDVLPTAMMKIQRSVFMRMAAAGKAPLRIEYHKDGSESQRYLSYFDFEADNDRHIEFGEDVAFCRKWAAMGGELWVDPDMTLRHYGVDHRVGNLHDHLRALPGGGGPAPADWKFSPRVSAA